MEITHHPGTDSLELRLKGRLDATWAEHVSNTIEDAVRAGSHQIVLNFAAVDYISSLGIRVLLNHYKRLKSVSGNLSIIQPTASTRMVLEAAGLAVLLFISPVHAVSAAVHDSVQRKRGNAIYELYPQKSEFPLSCSVIGRPESLKSGFTEADYHSLTFGEKSWGLGLGAFGEGFTDCRNRFGEFLAADGCAITLPTNDPHLHPDYVIEQSGLLPRVSILYGLIGRGDFSSMVHFDAAPEGAGKISVSELGTALFEFSGATMAAFVALVESSGLVGATIRKSPALGPLSLSLPDIRDSLTFTTERSTERTLALVIGLLASETTGPATPFMRPLNSKSGLQAHIHAAVFPYRPVQRGELAFSGTVKELLSASSPGTVMHLLADSRPYEGVGESEFLRGACWFGALPKITRDEN